MRLNELSDVAGARKVRVRAGRGASSGKGKTAGRGQKGQKSRSGVAIKGFEGGQMPIHRRLPKRGFKNIFSTHYVTVNVGRLQTAIDAKKLDPAKLITAQVLRDAGVVRRIKDGVRMLAKGELKSKVALEVAGASKAAIEAVEKAGGAITVLPRKQHDGGNKDEDKKKNKKKNKKARAKKTTDAGTE